MDEMDLLSQLNDAAPLRPRAYEQARVRLRSVMAESGLPDAAPVRRGIWSRAGNRRRVTIGTGIAAVAAGVAIAVALSSTPRPTVPAAAIAKAHSPLVSLADHIAASDTTLPGNASLVIEKQVNGGKLMQVLYAVYTDGGQLYTGDDKQTLMQAVADHSNQADGTNAREIAAAIYAATGDLGTARVKMVDALPNCYGLGLSPTAQKAYQAKCWAAGAAQRNEILREKGIKTPLKQPTGKVLQDDIDNTLWTASTIALSWGAGNPQIREGVLRLLSTISAVTVAKSTTDGQPTLTITAEPALFGGGSDQVLTVNAQTGIPVSSVETGGGLPTAVATDQVSRVTLAAIEAGRF